MTSKLKVYGWLEHVQACPPAANGSKQARVIIATTSWAEAARLSSSSLSFIAKMGATTENAAEVEAAMAQPGVALWTPDRNSQHARDWRILRPDLQPDPARAAVVAYRTLPTNLTMAVTTELENGREALAYLADKEKPGLEYIVSSRAYYHSSAMFQLRKDNIVEEVQFGRGIGPDNDGQDWCASFTWHYMGSGSPLACRLSAFDDAWAGLRESGALDVLDRDPHAGTVILDDICGALDNLGFRDVTPEEKPSGS